MNKEWLRLSVVGLLFLCIIQQYQYNKLLHHWNDWKIVMTRETIYQQDKRSEALYLIKEAEISLIVCSEKLKECK